MFAQAKWAVTVLSLWSFSLTMVAGREGVIVPEFLEVTPSLTDFGDVWPGQRSEVEVRLKNVHPSASLLITGLETHCRCSVSTLETRYLKPGETTAASVAMDFGAAVGERRDEATFAWRLDEDGGATGTATVEVTGNVVDLVVLPSVAISLGAIDKRAGEVGGEFRIAAGDSGVRVDALAVRSPLGGFRGEGSADGDGGFLVKYKLDPSSLPAGSFHEPVDLVFLDAEQERGARRMFVSGSVRNGMRVSPPSVVAHNAERGESIKQVLRITAENGTGPVRLNGDVTAKRGLVTVVRMRQSGEDLQLELALTPPAVAAPADGVNDEIIIPVAFAGGEESLKVSVVAFFSESQLVTSER